MRPCPIWYWTGRPSPPARSAPTKRSCAYASPPASRSERAERAISERRRLPGHWPRIALSATPAGYVSGQESALVNHLNGGPPKPTFSPPMPFERGVRRRPTLVNNAETLAHVALIERHGPRWFRELGLSEQPGSALLTLTGPVACPGVYEVEYGASLSSLLDAAGGTTSRVRAALFGGYAGTWIEGGALSDLRFVKRPPGPLRSHARRRRGAAALRGCLPGGRDRSCDALACPAERRPVRALPARLGRPRRDLRASVCRRRAQARGRTPGAARRARQQTRRLRPPRWDGSLRDERIGRFRGGVRQSR